MHQKNHLELKKKINCYSSTLYPGINPNKFSDEFINLNNSKNTIDELQILDLSYCGYVPLSVIIIL